MTHWCVLSPSQATSVGQIELCHDFARPAVTANESAWYLHRVASTFFMVEFLPADFALLDRQLVNRRHGRHAHYEPAALAKVMAELELQSHLAAAVVRAHVAGLRISEAVRLRGSDVWGRRRPWAPGLD